MRQKRNTITRLAVLGITVASLVACNKKSGEQQHDRALNAGVNALCGCATVPPAIGHATDSTITGTISSNLFLSNTKNYKLDKLVFVTNSATVTIAQGARIVGLAGTGTPGTPGATPGGGLVFTKGAKIQATGTSACPIIFTSYRYNNSPLPGDWSGVVLLGSAPTNQPTTTQVEGIGVHAPGGVDITYGGSTPADNSGTLKFVRIEYAGWELETDKEINGLTLAGVGTGTLIDFVEVYKANDDAFEFFGGTVNASHLISVDALDDMFDTDHGYVGTIRYALGLSDTARADKSQSNGIESDNNNVSPYTGTPFTHPTYNNFTIIGLPNSIKTNRSDIPPSPTGKYGRAAQLRRAAEFAINNSVFLGFKFGISLDTALPVSPALNTKDKYLSGTSTLSNNYTHAYFTNTTPANISPYIIEGNGNPPLVTGPLPSFNPAGFAVTNPIFRNFAIANPVAPNNNKPYVNANPNLNIQLANPFVRNNTNGAANYLTTGASPAGIQGAFPGGTDWTVVNGCHDWTRYKD